MERKEKVLIMVTILLVGIMVFKSLILDEVKPVGVDEIKFKSFVEKRIEDGKEELGILNKTGLSSFKVVKIQKITDEGTSQIIYYDSIKNSYINGTIQGQYKARVRGYILYVVPYKEFTVEVGSEIDK